MMLIQCDKCKKELSSDTTASKLDIIIGTVGQEPHYDLCLDCTQKIISTIKIKESKIDMRIVQTKYAGEAVRDN